MKVDQLNAETLSDCVCCVLKAGEEVRVRSGTQAAALKTSSTSTLNPPLSCSFLPLHPAWISQTLNGTVCCTSYGPLSLGAPVMKWMDASLWILWDVCKSAHLCTVRGFGLFISRTSFRHSHFAWTNSLDFCMSPPHLLRFRLFFCSFFVLFLL